MPTTISYGKHTTPSIKPVPASPAGGGGKKIVEMTGFGEVLRSAMEVFKHNVRYEIGKAILECATWKIVLEEDKHLQPDLHQWVETESGDQGITYMVNVLNEPLNREHGQQKDYDEVKTILKEGKGDLIKRITNQRCWQIRETLETEYLYPGHSAFLFKNGWEVSEDFTLKLTFDALKVTGETGSDKSDALNFWDKDIIEELEYMLKDVTFEMPGADFDPDAKWIESVAGEKNPEPNRTIYMTQEVGLSIKFHEGVKMQFESHNHAIPSFEIDLKNHCVRIKGLRVRGELKVDEAEGDDKHDDQNRPDKTEFAFGVKLWVVNKSTEWDMDWKFDVKLNNGGWFDPTLPDFITEDWLKGVLEAFISDISGEATYVPPPNALFIRFQNREMDMDELMNTIPEIEGILTDGTGYCFKNCVNNCFKNCMDGSCLKDCWQTACFCATCAACVGTGQPCWDCIADSDCCPKKEPEPES